MSFSGCEVIYGVIFFIDSFSVVNINIGSFYDFKYWFSK